MQPDLLRPKLCTSEGAVTGTKATARRAACCLSAPFACFSVTISEWQLTDILPPADEHSSD